jgi:hypothetical protein
MIKCSLSAMPPTWNAHPGTPHARPSSNQSLPFTTGRIGSHGDTPQTVVNRPKLSFAFFIDPRARGHGTLSAARAPVLLFSNRSSPRDETALAWTSDILLHYS